MKFFYILLAACSAILFSCNTQSPSVLSSFLNREQLPLQVFTVNIGMDTTLITQNGVRISIPKGSLESDSNNLRLEIKEALTNTDIVLAGLTTQSGGKMLSSGGMIYFNTAPGYTAKIKKEIKMMVPTNNYNPGMQVFKGEEEKDGKIDWISPEPLPKDEIQNKISAGEIFYKSNCASCHKITSDFTGPALYGITERRPKKWLYDFTRNPLNKNASPVAEEFDSSKKEGSSRDYYSECLYARFRPTVMTAFPQLSDENLDGLYAYIKTESDKRPDLKEAFEHSCCDSCAEYKTQVAALENKRTELIKDNHALFTLDQRFPSNANVISVPPPYTNVTPTYTTATYYTINIQTMGWHNIDEWLDGETPGCVPSQLFVQMQGNYNVDITCCLMIPSVKVFVEGGKLNNNKGYGFDNKNGSIPLPQNVTCYVIAFAEYKDRIIFGKLQFTSGRNQTIQIPLSETTKPEMLSQIKDLNLDGIGTQINKTKNADEIIKTDRKIEELQKLKPKNCSCTIGEKDVVQIP